MAAAETKNKLSIKLGSRLALLALYRNINPVKKNNEASASHITGIQTSPKSFRSNEIKLHIILHYAQQSIRTHLPIKF